MDTSTLRRSLDMILDESRQYYKIISDTYYIHEETLTDRVDQIDFKKIFSFIFDKFIDIITNIWNQFRSSYKEFIAESELIKKYRRQMENINWDVEIDEERCIFTNLDSAANSLTYLMTLSDQYNILIQDFSDLSKCRDVGSIHTKIVDIKNSMEDLESFLDQQRGKSLRSDSSISREDYAKAVTDYFCPDQKISSKIIHPSETKEMLQDYFIDKKLEKVITQDEYNLTVESAIIRDKLIDINIDKYCPDQIINDEIADIFVDIIREYCNRFQGLCNIYTILFSIKLDIFKIYKRQQTRILSKIILKSIKEGKING
jgi:hypothetical protein